ncbi:MAG: amino acid racemase [Candidatus Saccharibacteria bacterium]|nr:amino acid racemase [Candidatus Saccharibacteria bacterium]
MRPTIGILGGMGPRATVQFEQLLLDRLPGSDQELPVIISLNDGGIPDRSDFLLGIGPDPLPRMQANLQTLEQAGAQVICVPCNTACAPAIMGRLAPEPTTNILNLPELVISDLVQNNIKKVVLLATIGTVRANVYQQLCADNDIDCLLPKPHLQRQVMEIIRLVKRGELTRARLVAKQVHAFLDSNSDCVAILGCTELPLIQDALVSFDSHAIDTLAILANACVQYITQAEKELAL